MSIKLHGAALSPFVRKARIVLALKGVDYEPVHVDPANLPDGFEKMSPMRRIPVLEVDGQYLPDSAAICAYLEDTFPATPLYPKDAFEHGRVVWLQRYIDYDLAQYTTFHVFRNRVILPLIGKECDETRVQKALTEKLPAMFAYLNDELTGKTYLVGDSMTVADIALASQMVNFAHGGETLDADKYPALAAHIERMHALAPFAKTIEKESAFVANVRGGQ